MNLDAAGYDTDKWPALLEAYARLLEPLKDSPMVLLELGVLSGGSLRLWRDNLPLARVVGLDVAPVTIDDPTGRIAIYRGSQSDTALLDQIAALEAPQGFDFIIDDASHVGHLTRASFWHLFRRHLKAGGIFCIEDWGTGYWSSWPDGQNYQWEPDSPLHRGWTANQPLEATQASTGVTSTVWLGW